LVGHIYNNIEDVVELSGKLLFIQAFGYLFDCESNIRGSITRTIGSEKYVAKSYFISYYYVATPCLIVVRAGFNGDVLACWGCALVGYYVMFGQLIGKYWKIDWEEETRKLHEKLIREKE